MSHFDVTVSVEEWAFGVKLTDTNVPLSKAIFWTGSSKMETEKGIADVCEYEFSSKRMKLFKSA